MTDLHQCDGCNSVAAHATQATFRSGRKERGNYCADCHDLMKGGDRDWPGEQPNNPVVRLDLFEPPSPLAIAIAQEIQMSSYDRQNRQSVIDFLSNRFPQSDPKECERIGLAMWDQFIVYPKKDDR